MVEGLPEPFAAYNQEPVDLGRSGAQVFRLSAPNKPMLYLKKSEAAYSDHLRDTAARLEWLKRKLPVPEVVHFYEDADGASLLMTAVAGVDLTHFNCKSLEVKKHMTVELARALRHFHEVDARDCPFDHSAVGELGRLEADILAREASGQTLRRARERLERLRASMPEETLVLTHGDACLPSCLGHVSPQHGWYLWD